MPLLEARLEMQRRIEVEAVQIVSARGFDEFHKGEGNKATLSDVQWKSKNRKRLRSRKSVNGKDEKRYITAPKQQKLLP